MPLAEESPIAIAVSGSFPDRGEHANLRQAGEHGGLSHLPRPHPMA
jgi:hypothetical protein